MKLIPLLSIVFLSLTLYASTNSHYQTTSLIKDTTNKFDVPCLGYKFIICEKKRKEVTYYRTNEFSYVGRDFNCLVFKSSDTSIITLLINQTRVDIDSCQ